MKHKHFIALFGLLIGASQLEAQAPANNNIANARIVSFRGPGNQCTHAYSELGIEHVPSYTVGNTTVPYTQGDNMYYQSNVISFHSPTAVPGPSNMFGGFESLASANIESGETSTFTDPITGLQKTFNASTWYRLRVPKFALMDLIIHTNSPITNFLNTLDPAIAVYRGAGFNVTNVNQLTLVAYSDNTNEHNTPSSDHYKTSPSFRRNTMSGGNPGSSGCYNSTPQISSAISVLPELYQSKNPYIKLYNIMSAQQGPTIVKGDFIYIQVLGNVGPNNCGEAAGRYDLHVEAKLVGDLQCKRMPSTSSFPVSCEFTWEDLDALSPVRSSPCNPATTSGTVVNLYKANDASLLSPGPLTLTPNGGAWGPFEMCNDLSDPSGKRLVTGPSNVRLSWFGQSAVAPLEMTIGFFEVDDVTGLSTAIYETYFYTNVPAIGGVSTGLKSTRVGETGKEEPQEAAVSNEISTKTVEAFSVKLSPNPTSKVVNLELELQRDSEMALTIIDAYGKVCYSSSIKMASGRNIESINVSNLAKGAYFLQAIDDKGEKSSEILIIE